jgi:chemotaxis methyl-accepting protein methylase
MMTRIQGCSRHESRRFVKESRIDGLDSDEKVLTNAIMLTLSAAEKAAVQWRRAYFHLLPKKARLASSTKSPDN